MSDKLRDSLAPRLVAPVKRQPGGTAADSGAGAGLSRWDTDWLPFADDGDS